MYTRINDEVNAIIREGYFINYKYSAEPELPQFKHYFCGSHSIKGATCLNCQKPLLRFAIIDTQDARLKLEDIEVNELPLLFCWTCNIAQGDFFYQCLSLNEIKILKYKPGKESDDFPYENYPVFFPGRQAYLVKMSELEQDIITKLNGGKLDSWAAEQLLPNVSCEPSHQIGGEPYLVQGMVVKLTCPVCCNIMDFFAAIGDDAPDDKSFTGNPYVQVIYHFCRECCVFGVYQQCD